MLEQTATEAALTPLGCTHGAWVDIARSLGVARPRALEVYSGFFREGIEPPAELGGGEVSVPRVRRLERQESEHGEVRKFVLPIDGVRDRDGGYREGLEELETESVIIPMLGRRGLTHTLCVSSQVGCAMGCGFCETAQMGLLRSLTPAEIVQQWHAATHQVGERIDNIVFMGMGEPLDNVENVIAAIAVLADQRGPAVPMKRITVSTVGKLDGLARLADQVREPGWRKLGLAVSVNAPNDEIRSSIMPVNRAMPLDELLGAMRAWPKRTHEVMCVEYVLIPGVNDADEHADELSSRLGDLRCCVNVIPYNPRRDSPWPAPDEATIERFLSRLRGRGVFAKRRRTKGRESWAACGQLGNDKIRRRRLVGVTVGGG